MGFCSFCAAFVQDHAELLLRGAATVAAPPQTAAVGIRPDPPPTTRAPSIEKHRDSHYPPAAHRWGYTISSKVYREN